MRDDRDEYCVTRANQSDDTGNAVITGTPATGGSTRIAPILLSYFHLVK